MYCSVARLVDLHHDDFETPDFQLNIASYAANLRKSWGCITPQFVPEPQNVIELCMLKNSRRYRYVLLFSFKSYTVFSTCANEFEIDR